MTLRTAPIHHRNIRFMNAIGSVSVRIFQEDGSHTVVTFRGKECGSLAYKYLWANAYEDAMAIMIRIGRGPWTVTHGNLYNLP